MCFVLIASWKDLIYEVEFLVECVESAHGYCGYCVYQKYHLIILRRSSDIPQNRASDGMELVNSLSCFSVVLIQGRMQLGIIINIAYIHACIHLFSLIQSLS